VYMCTLPCVSNPTLEVFALAQHNIIISHYFNDYLHIESTVLRPYPLINHTAGQLLFHTFVLNINTSEMRFSECKKDRNQFYDTNIRCRMPTYPNYPACQVNMQHLRALISCYPSGFRYYYGNTIFFSNASSLTSRTR